MRSKRCAVQNQGITLIVQNYTELNSLLRSRAGRGAVAVSYTHLRAHETDSYLVCRLLLEKKN